MKKAERQALIAWTVKAQGALRTATEDQWRALDAWRSQDHDYWEWPGWEQLAGPRPEIAGFTRKEFIPDAVRWEVWERDNFTCKKCGARRFLSIDHIIPESKGGTLALDNLQTLCKPCNRAKGVR